MAVKLGASARSALQRRHIHLHEQVRLTFPVSFAPPVRVHANTTLNRCRVGAFSYVSPGCALHHVSIGRYCSIGDGVQILSQHPTDRLTTHPFTYQSIFPPPFSVSPSQAYASIETTEIGNDVWIGSGVRIKSGARIGDGAIVAAGAVVTKDVAAFSVVGGVPAKLIRMRFGPDLIAALQRTKWWEYNLLHLSLPWDDPAAALRELQRLVDAGELQPYRARWVDVR